MASRVVEGSVVVGVDVDVLGGRLILGEPGAVVEVDVGGEGEAGAPTEADRYGPGIIAKVVHYLIPRADVLPLVGVGAGGSGEADGPGGSPRPTDPPTMESLKECEKVCRTYVG